MADSKIVVEGTEAGVSIRKQKRAVLTRQELLRSARAIFAKDGFEQARLEEIAANAGKTRGAFYDHFKDKEDVFFAIFEENLDREMAELGPVLSVLPTLGERIDALCAHMKEKSKDRERTLLNLEFKLYAIRHPGQTKRLADLHTVMLLRSSVPELIEMLSGVMGGTVSDPLGDCPAIGAVMDGLGLSYLFDPDAVNDERLGRYLRICLQESMGISSRGGTNDSGLNGMGSHLGDGESVAKVGHPDFQ